MTAEEKALLAELARQLESLPDRLAEAVQRASRKESRVLLSYSEAAKRLGIDRHRIPGLVSSKAIRVVKDGATPKISLLEIERIQREGLLTQGTRRRRAPEPPENPGDDIRDIDLT